MIQKFTPLFKYVDDVPSVSEVNDVPDVLRKRYNDQLVTTGWVWNKTTLNQLAEVL